MLRPKTNGQGWEKTLKTRYDIDSIIKCLSKTEYGIDIDSEFMLNLVGIRSHKKSRKMFSDTICAIINIYGDVRYCEIEATTRASVDGLITPARPGCYYMLPAGMYKDAWKIIYNNSKIVQNIPMPSLYAIPKEGKRVSDKDFFKDSPVRVRYGIEIKPIMFLTKATKFFQELTQYTKKPMGMGKITGYAAVQKTVLNKNTFSYILIDDIDGQLIAQNKIYGEDNYGGT